jgi:YHS domain-containing protein
MTRLLAYILDLVFALIIGRLISQLFHPGIHRVRRNAGPGPERPAGTIHTMRDPVCGTFVSTELSRRLKWEGQVLHFCSQECLEKFQSHSIHPG